jgi:hypothetical protein
MWYPARSTHVRLLWCISVQPGLLPAWYSVPIVQRAVAAVMLPCPACSYVKPGLSPTLYSIHSAAGCCLAAASIPCSACFHVQLGLSPTLYSIHSAAGCCLAAALLPRSACSHVQSGLLPVYPSCSWLWPCCCVVAMSSLVCYQCILRAAGCGLAAALLPCLAWFATSVSLVQLAVALLLRCCHV